MDITMAAERLTRVVDMEHGNSRQPNCAVDLSDGRLCAFDRPDIVTSAPQVRDVDANAKLRRILRRLIQRTCQVLHAVAELPTAAGIILQQQRDAARGVRERSL